MDSIWQSAKHWWFDKISSWWEATSDQCLLGSPAHGTARHCRGGRAAGCGRTGAAGGIPSLPGVEVLCPGAQQVLWEPGAAQTLSPCWGPAEVTQPRLSPAAGAAGQEQRGARLGTGAATPSLKQDPEQGTKREHHFWISAEAALNSASQKSPPAAWSQLTATPCQNCCWVPATKALGRSGGEAAELVRVLG